MDDFSPIGDRLTVPEVVIDLEAVRHNVRLLRRVASPASVMVVVKADAYGHGMVPIARAACEAGSDWLGVATDHEALALRAAGYSGPLLCWLGPVSDTVREAVGAGIDITAYSLEELDAIADLAGASPARVQLKLDTGMSRGGCPIEDWPALLQRARELEVAGRLVVTGIWSHLACADTPEHDANDVQEAAFRRGLEVAAAVGLRPEVRHLANSAGTLLRTSTHFDLVRVGLATYGLDPAVGSTPPELAAALRPAMTVRAPLILTKEVPAGAAVSYGHTWVAPAQTNLGLVSIGYADGVPRHVDGRVEVLVDGERRPVRGRICMDQFVIDLDGTRPQVGTPVVLWGPGGAGEPTAQDWAENAHTITNELVTRLGGRLVRRHVDCAAAGRPQPRFWSAPPEDLRRLPASAAVTSRSTAPGTSRGHPE